MDKFNCNMNYKKENRSVKLKLGKFMYGQMAWLKLISAHNILRLISPLLTC